MNKRIMTLVAGLAWAGAALGATHEGVQLWENGPLWAKTNVGANSPTETGYYFWWGDTLGYKWQNSKWVASDGSVNNFSFSTANCPTYGKSLAQLQSMGYVGPDGNLLPAHDAAVQQWGDAWRGLAFERLCLCHIPQIRAALGISGVLTDVYSWRAKQRLSG